jgi:HSP20 family protein
MSLMKWEPARELSRVRDEMDRIFSQTLGAQTPDGTALWSPTVDVREENGNIIVEADLPGVKKEDVEITATDDSITLEGHTQSEKEEKKDGYYRRERRSGRFLRTLPLPVTVDAEKAQASFNDGTITVTLPKVAEAPKGRKVEVS